MDNLYKAKPKRYYLLSLRWHLHLHFLLFLHLHVPVHKGRPPPDLIHPKCMHLCDTHQLTVSWYELHLLLVVPLLLSLQRVASFPPMPQQHGMKLPVSNKMQIKLLDMWDTRYHGCEIWSQGLLGCDAILYCGRKPAHHRTMKSPWRRRQQGSPKYWYPPVLLDSMRVI